MKTVCTGTLPRDETSPTAAVKSLGWTEVVDPQRGRDTARAWSIGWIDTADAQHIDGPAVAAGGRRVGAHGILKMAERPAEFVGGTGRHRAENRVGRYQAARGIEQAVQHLVRGAVATHCHEATGAA